MNCTFLQKRICLILLLALPLLLLVGCKRGGVDRVTVSGEVTYNGQPVPGGFVLFKPDTKKNNSGPQGHAQIVNGRYATTDKGSVSGPQIVEIHGYSSAAGPQGDSLFPPLLFPTYITEADIPDDSTTINFEVPVKR